MLDNSLAKILICLLARNSFRSELMSLNSNPSLTLPLPREGNAETKYNLIKASLYLILGSLPVRQTGEQEWVSIPVNHL